ncbi:MAG TPA: hypothetical protein VLX28_04950, partial [Thermoanaerobaculia bacterium]|nr:hypothetical protein [Thermoanaerobaculia bacterium]
MSFRWRRAALWAVLAPFFFLACVPPVTIGGPHSRGRVSNTRSLGKLAVAGALSIGPDLVFRRDGVDGKAVVRGGWPFVVAYELEQPGHLRLTITPKSGAATSYRIPAVGTVPAGSRQESDKFHLSTALGNAIQEGSLSLRAYAGDNEDQPV